MILALAAAGLLVGAALPWLIARIPDRVPAGDAPPPTPYRDLAAAPRLPLVLALATAAVWAVLGLAWPGWVAELPAYLLVSALGVAMSYVDLREHRLPDWLTLPALAAGAVALAVAAAATGSWADYGRAWAGAGATTVFYLVLVLIRPADLGLGDVKLAAAVGLLLGWLGWSYVVLGIFLAFVLGGLAGIILLALRKVKRRTALPFGPFMLAGMIVAVVWGAPIIDAYLGR
ncbi:MAG TPA: A24 family peptidase [Jiangellaceae bacterium]